jgi:putative ABC transport system permease protein
VSSRGALRICGMRVSMLLFMHRRRLRAHLVGELLALAGVAVGVALVFGVLLANTSLTSSAGRLVHSLAGDARFELAARSQQGMPESVARAAEALPGVEVAAPVLRSEVTLAGPRGAEAVQLVGVSPSVEDLGGLASEELAVGTALLKGGVGLTASVASQTGARRRGSVRIAAAGQSHAAPVRYVLAGTLSSLSSSPVVVAVLGTAQQLTGAGHRVSDVLIKPQAGRAAAVHGELERLAGAGLIVRMAEGELRLLEVATAPNRQSTTLFTAIAVMIGFLLAFSATLLTIPERRRFIAELRIHGYDSSQVALLLVFQALVLGLCASAVGIGAGYAVSDALLQRVPDFLSAAFPIGAQASVTAGAVIAALLCGVLATVVASLAPLLDVRGEARAEDDPLRRAYSRSEMITPRTVARLALAGAVLIALALALSLAAASLTILGGVALALAAACLAPAVLFACVQLLPQWLEGLRSGALIVALAELRALSARAVALTAIVALAVYGVVAIGGARKDLLRGVQDATDQYFSTAPVWVTSGRDVFNTGAFPQAAAKLAARAPGVASVRVYRGGLLDVGARRMWVRARPAADRMMLEASQAVEGSPARADAEIAAGGWVALSSAFAHERHLHLGQRFGLPTPTGVVSARLAAVMTNSGWPPGTITISAADYARWWGSSDAAALEVELKPGLSPAQGAASVQATLAAAYPGLRARTAAQRVAQSAASARQGLATLTEISTLLLIAASLAVAASLAAAIWQRRMRIASLKVSGLRTAQLWGAILIESAITLLAGSLLGALIGCGGHALASRFLQLSTGFPAPFALGIGALLGIVGLFCAIALVVLALAGAAAARVAPSAVLQE